MKIDRYAFFAFYSVACIVGSILFSYLSYDVFTCKEWAVEFDPLTIEIARVDSIESGYELSTGMILEVARTALGAVALFVLVGVYFDYRVFKSQFPSIGLDTSDPFDIFQKEVTPKTVAPLLWSSVWKLSVVSMVLVLVGYHFWIGPKELKDSWSTPYSQETLPFIPTSRTLPKQVLEDLKSDSDWDRSEVFEAASEKGWWTSINSKSSDLTILTQPYTWYFFYSTINFVFVLLPLVVHCGLFFRNVTQPLVSKVATLTGQIGQLDSYPEIQAKLENEGKAIIDGTKGILRPCGWLITFAFINATFELLIGRLNLASMALIFACLGYLILFATLIFVAILLDRVEAYSKAIPAVGTDEEKQRIEEWKKRCSAESILDATKEMYIWKIFFFLCRKVKQQIGS